jgi:hypothetical protein
MATRRNSRKSARRRHSRENRQGSRFLSRSLYGRRLRYEPLEDRRLLALVTVTTLADTVDFNDNVTSLREAIFATNLVGGEDTIEFARSLISNLPGTIQLKQGELKITDSLTIVGPGAGRLTIDASGNDPTPELNNGDGSRVFSLERANARTTFNVSISGLTLTGGDVGSSGGAILGRESLVLNEMAIIDNATREYGGGVFFVDENSAIQNTLEIRNSTISGNTAQPGGGGVAARIMGGTLMFTSNVITGNKATGLSSRGGGIYTNLRNTQATIVGNAVGENTAGFGGGIWASNVTGQMLIDESRIFGNAAIVPKGQGGGILFTGDSNVATLRNSTVENNSATGIGGRGGGVYAAGDSAVIERSTITGNQAGGTGGGIYNRAALTLRETTVAGNSVINPKGNGGGIFHTGPRNIKVVASTISGNSAAFAGGGIFIIGGSPDGSTIDRSSIKGNLADYDGGGILLSTGRLQLNDSTVAENSAGRDAGGILVLQGTATITHSTINNNTAEANGGGVMSKAHATTIVNSTLSGNRATLNGGALWSSREVALRHTTVAFNRADQLGGGVFVNDGSLALNHTIVAHNVASFGRDLSGLLGASINATYSLVGSSQGSGLTPAPVGSPDANGNLIGGATSGFIVAGLGELADNGGPTKTHALLFGSPAINAGDPAAIAAEESIPQFDQRGEPYARVRGGRIDMGAFEFHQGPILDDYNDDGGVNAADYVFWRKMQGSPTAFGGSVDASQVGVIVSNDVSVAEVGVQEAEAAIGEAAIAQVVLPNVGRGHQPLTATAAESISSGRSRDSGLVVYRQCQLSGGQRARFDLLADSQAVRPYLQPLGRRDKGERWDLESTDSASSIELHHGAVDAVFEWRDSALIDASS